MPATATRIPRGVDVRRAEARGKTIFSNPAIYSDFCVLAEKSLDGRELRFTQRQRLIALGEKKGLTRFDANLLIAMVQHRAENSFSRRACSPAKQQRESRFGLFAAIALTQSIIAITAWSILH